MTIYTKCKKAINQHVTTIPHYLFVMNKKVYAKNKSITHIYLYA